jgi:hypothetical protein
LKGLRLSHLAIGTAFFAGILIGLPAEVDMGRPSPGFKRRLLTGQSISHPRYGLRRPQGAMEREKREERIGNTVERFDERHHTL